MNAHEEAMQIWKYLEPMVERKIRDAMAPLSDVRTLKLRRRRTAQQLV